MKDKITADGKVEEKNLLRRFEDKPLYLPMGHSKGNLEGRARRG